MSSSNGRPGSPSVALCASCDRCRARKTKCDGARPCGNCAAKYLKKNKLTSLDGIDVSLFECVYSPAKRRGPVPGKATTNGAETKGTTSRKRDSDTSKATNNESKKGCLESFLMKHENQKDARQPANSGIMGGSANSAIGGNNINAGAAGNNLNALMSQYGMNLGLGTVPGAGSGNTRGESEAWQMQKQMLDNQQQLAALQGMTSNNTFSSAGHGTNMELQSQLQQLQLMQQLQQQQQSGNSNGLGQQLNYLQQLQYQQQQLQVALSQQQPTNPTQEAHTQQKGSKGERSSGSKPPKKSQRSEAKNTVNIQKTVQSHLLELLKNNPDGNRLRSFFDLSINELFCLPPIPTDDEYCSRLPPPAGKPRPLPKFDLAALQAARFSEIALGALVNNQISLALELSNATVVCLRQFVMEPVHPSCMYDVARAYFLHGIFRSLRGDMQRYFKHRRVCLTHLRQIGDIPGTQILLAAISFQDSWAYMVHNATESDLPDIDDVIPRVPIIDSKSSSKSDATSIVSNPSNQMWIQGTPQIFNNIEAPLMSRSLDALACAIRNCCDQANDRFKDLEKKSKTKNGGIEKSKLTRTPKEDEDNGNRANGRNLVLSAFTLLQQHEAANRNIKKNNGHHLIISAMDAFLEGGSEIGSDLKVFEGEGFTDSQIQSLLCVCNTVIEHPLLLHQAGPAYHLVSNAAIMLCHLLNGMHANSSWTKNNDCNEDSSDFQCPEMEAALFEEVLDTFIAVRKILNVHRRKLPSRIRCHGIPRPKVISYGNRSAQRINGKGCNGTSSPDLPFIDLGDTLMCRCRGCQGFVLMGCSPYIAAERAKAAALQALNSEEPKDANDVEVNEFDKELYELGVEFDLDDDALLNVLSRIIAT